MRREDEKEKPSCDSPACGCGPQPVSIGRRDFLAVTGLGAASMLIPDLPAVAGPFEGKDFEDLVPSDKKLKPDWVRGLTECRQPEVYRGNELNWVGMPVGGIACGQLYLGGDGRLWYWDIFTSTTTTDYENKIWAGPHYEHPLQPKPVVDQGFAIRVKQGEKTVSRALDRRGFKDITFRGEYPIGRVSYRDEALPFEVNLEAFSPFIPLNVEDSSLPATILSFQVKNTSQEPLEVSLAGWLENAVCRTGDGGLSLSRRNVVVRRGPERATLLGSVEVVPAQGTDRPDVVFADFEGKTTAAGMPRAKPLKIDLITPTRSGSTRLFRATRGKALSTLTSCATGKIRRPPIFTRAASPVPSSRLSEDSFTSALAAAPSWKSWDFA